MLKVVKPTKIKLVIVAGLAIVLASLWLIPGPDKQGAMIMIDPQQPQVQQGKQWTATITVHSTVQVNAADVVVSFPTDEVEIMAADMEDVDFSTPIFQPEVDTDNGQVHFVQASLQPRTGHSSLGHVRLKAKKSSHPKATVEGQIISHDGQGTNVFYQTIHQSVGQWLTGRIFGAATT